MIGGFIHSFTKGLIDDEEDTKIKRVDTTEQQKPESTTPPPPPSKPRPAPPVQAQPQTVTQPEPIFYQPPTPPPPQQDVHYHHASESVYTPPVMEQPAQPQSKEVVYIDTTSRALPHIERKARGKSAPKPKKPPVYPHRQPTEQTSPQLQPQDSAEVLSAIRQKHSPYKNQPIIIDLEEEEEEGFIDETPLVDELPHSIGLRTTHETPPPPTAAVTETEIEFIPPQMIELDKDSDLAKILDGTWEVPEYEMPVARSDKKISQQMLSKIEKESRLAHQPQSPKITSIPDITTSEAAQIIDGRELSKKIRAKLKTQAEEFEKKCGRQIGIAVLIIGDDAASHTYVRNKVKACEEIGVKSFVVMRDSNTTQEELIDMIRTLNDSPEVDGIITQLPLPKHLNETEILEIINPKKDIDCFHIQNVGKLFTGQDGMRPCTPAGIIELVKSTKKRLEGKHAVVIGRSNIVGKPVAQLLLQENCTVTICHSRTKNLARITKKADILVAAIGKREFVTADMVKKGAIVIDVGINRDVMNTNRIYGDVNFEEVSKIASHITPVPGGVGPMTITMLMANAVTAATNR